MNVVEKIQESLKQEIANAVLKAGLAAREQLPEVILETPKDKSHGDYSTNMAMQLARVAKKPLVKSLKKSKIISMERRHLSRKLISRDQALLIFTWIIVT